MATPPVTLSPAQKYAQWLEEQRMIERQKRRDEMFSPESSLRFFLWGASLVGLLFMWTALKKYREGE